MQKITKLSLLFMFFYSITFGQIVVDGDISDWTAEMQFDVAGHYLEDIGDSVDTDYDGVMDGVINPALDVKDVFVTHDSDNLYFRIDINEDGTFTDLESLVDGGYQAAIQVFLDTDVDTSTGLTWGHWLTSGDYWINFSVKRGWPGFELTVDYGIMKNVGTAPTESVWEEVAGANCQVAVNLDDNIMEVAIPRAALGETNGEMESTGFLILAEDPTSGWVNDAAPSDFDNVMSVYRYGQQGMVIDGDISDWTADMQFDVEGHYLEDIGDSVDTDYDGVMDGVINPALDVKDVYVTHDDNNLIFRIDINQDGTFTDLESLVDGGYQAAIQVFLDTDVDTSTGLTWGHWLTSGDYWVNFSVKRGWPGFELTVDYGIMKNVGTTPTESVWEEVEGANCQVAVNLDDNIMEIAIPRAALGETNATMESTGFLILAEDPTSGWVNDAAPSDFDNVMSVYRYGQQGMVIDGDISDWTADMLFDVEENYLEETGDSVDTDYDGVMDGVINPALDVKDVYVTHDDNNLIFRIDINEDGTFTDLESLVDGGYQAAIQVFLDTDVDTSTGLTWGHWLTSGDYWINFSVKRGWPGFELENDYGIMKNVGTSPTESVWEEVEGASCQVAVNLDDNIMEIAIPRAVLGETNATMESTGFLILAEDPTSGWVNDAVPSDMDNVMSIYGYGNTVTDIKNEVSTVPNSFKLEQNYPNPFNPTTHIKFSLAKRANVSLSVYNVLGQQVASLLADQEIAAGVHSVEFNASKLSSGIYIYVVETGNIVSAKKMMLLK